MDIKTGTPKIGLLKQIVEKSIDFPLSTHGDFLRLSAGIEFTLREHMNVSVRTLNVLARFVGYHNWDEFCSASEKTEEETINSTMQPGDTFPCLQIQICRNNSIYVKLKNPGSETTWIFILTV